MAAGRSLDLIPTDDGHHDPATVPFFGCGQHTPRGEFTRQKPYPVVDITVLRCIDGEMVRCVVEGVCERCHDGVGNYDPLARTGKLGLCMGCGREQR